MSDTSCVGVARAQDKQTLCPEVQTEGAGIGDSEWRRKTQKSKGLGYMQMQMQVQVQQMGWVGCKQQNPTENECFLQGIARRCGSVHGWYDDGGFADAAVLSCNET